jgi:hypothetical protein
VSGTDTKAISGEILRITTNPGATAPTDNYDVVILDEDGFDVAARSTGGPGHGKHRAGRARHRNDLDRRGQVPARRAVVVDGKLSLVVAAAGNAKQGVVTLYYR